jgi:hypothetical protein
MRFDVFCRRVLALPRIRRRFASQSPAMSALWEINELMSHGILLPKRQLRELHLFAGGGGGILGGILLGHTPVCAVEIESYCRNVILQRQRDGILPRFPIWDDVRTFDGRPWKGLVDVVCAGIPCQRVSTAGKGGGDLSTRTTTQALSESFAKWSPKPYSWKTPQCLFEEDLIAFSGIWPRWGMMRDGECWEVSMQERRTPGNEFGFLATPSGTSNHGQNHVAGRLDEWGPGGNPFRGTPLGKLHCPRFEEWLMGWPDQWSAPTALGTDKFQQWLHSHGTPSQTD